jgi:hypothetical protein
VTTLVGARPWGCVHHAANAWLDLPGARFTAATRPGALLEAMHLVLRLAQGRQA